MRGFASLLPILVLMPIGGAACGGSSMPAPVARATAAKPKPADARGAALAPGTLRRKDVRQVVEAGFARFLAQVAVEPRLVDGQFRGWSIVELRPAKFWAAVDLKPGDVVTSVNGLPIERETEAFDVFESLPKSDRLLVAFERDGQARTLQYRILAEADPSAVAKSATR